MRREKTGVARPAPFHEVGYRKCPSLHTRTCGGRGGVAGGVAGGGRDGGGPGNHEGGVVRGLPDSARKRPGDGTRGSDRQRWPASILCMLRGPPSARPPRNRNPGGPWPGARARGTHQGEAALGDGRVAGGRVLEVLHGDAARGAGLVLHGAGAGGADGVVVRDAGAGEGRDGERHLGLPEGRGRLRQGHGHVRHPRPQLRARPRQVDLLRREQLPAGHAEPHQDVPVVGRAGGPQRVPRRRAGAVQDDLGEGRLAQHERVPPPPLPLVPHLHCGHRDGRGRFGPPGPLAPLAPPAP